MEDTTDITFTIEGEFGKKISYKKQSRLGFTKLNLPNDAIILKYMLT